MLTYSQARRKPTDLGNTHKMLTGKEEANRSSEHTQDVNLLKARRKPTDLGNTHKMLTYSQARRKPTDLGNTHKMVSV